MIFVSRSHSFETSNNDVINDAPALIKVQIENSLDLGWKKEDILLFTNFEYEDLGIKAFVLKDSEFSKDDLDFLDFRPRSFKFNVINKLFEKNLIPDSEEIYWFHDLDAYQLEPITTDELEMQGRDMASVDCHQAYRANHISWNTCSFFFKSSAKDIFIRTLELAYKNNTDEESALTQLTIDDVDMRNRIKILDYRYTIKRSDLEERYLFATKPIKIVHFHPIMIRDSTRPIDKFMGENKLHLQLIPSRLVDLFKKQGIFTEYKP
jgi:hypothetical protein